MISKRGSSHLEMIFSFVFFVGFVFFLLLTLKPYDTVTMPKSVNFAIANSLFEKTSTNLTTFFLKVNYPMLWGYSCFEVPLTYDLGFKYDFTNSYVSDLTKPVISDINSAGKLSVSSDKQFFKVMLSSEFPENSLSNCGSINSFEIGSILNQQVLSYNTLKELSDKYKSNYESSKNELGVPEVYDYSITCDTLPEINMDKEVVGSVDVLAADYIFEVLDNEGNITNSKFTVKIW